MTNKCVQSESSQETEASICKAIENPLILSMISYIDTYKSLDHRYLKLIPCRKLVPHLFITVLF